MIALHDVILASASPRRVELLRSLGFRVDVRPTEIEEGDVPGLTPRELAIHHSAAKGDAALSRRSETLAGERPALIVSSDTVVDLDGRALGKPNDVDEARAMLRELSGREHLVHTAIDVIDGGSKRRIAAAETTAVRFFELDRATVDAYAESGDGLDKAGAYGIQGLGAALVERIDGDFYTVMGFPIGRFVHVMRELGYVPPAFAPRLARLSG